MGRKRLKERDLKTPTISNQMAQVTYRGVQYDTNRPNNTNVNAEKAQLVYRGVKVNKED